MKVLESRGRLAAVNSYDLTGEVVRLVGGEKHDRLCNLFRGAKAFHRDGRSRAGFPLGSTREAVEQLGVHGPGSDRVDAHAGRSTFERGGFGQTLNGVLAGNVPRRARSAGAAHG